MKEPILLNLLYLSHLNSSDDILDNLFKVKIRHINILEDEKCYRLCAHVTSESGLIHYQSRLCVETLVENGITSVTFSDDLNLAGGESGVEVKLDKKFYLDADVINVMLTIGLKETYMD